MKTTVNGCNFWLKDPVGLGPKTKFCGPAHWRSQDLFWWGTLFQKNFQKICIKDSIIFQKNLKKFRKFLKIFLRKMLKMDYFRIVFSQFNNARGQFLRVWTENAICRKIKKKFVRKLQKCIILAYFSKNLTNPALLFCAFGRKWQFIGNFEKISEKFEKFSSENC